MRLCWLLLTCLTACAPAPPPDLPAPRDSVLVSSAGSGILLARVDGGIIVIDLGWWGADEAVERGLRELGASAEEVSAVFLTHSHRDHVAGWRSVRHAPFHMAAAEVDLLFGRERHGGWIPRWIGRVKGSDLPSPEEVTVRPFGADTAYVFGRDTVRAFHVPGHTAGSAAYLFRGRLFAGDAIARTWISGFRPALGPYSESVDEARRSLESLRDRLAPYRVLSVCTAHAECTAVTDAFWSDLLEK